MKKFRALVFCLFPSLFLFSQGPPEVDGIFKDGISINRGSDFEITENQTKKVNYRVY